MDFHLKQWRVHHHESDHQHKQQQQQQQPQQPPPSLPGNIPISLPLQPHYHIHHQQQQQQEDQEEEAPSEPALPLFVPQSLSTKTTSNLSAAYPDSTSPPSTRLIPRMVGGYFNLAQMQELELQALIYRHMVAGAAVPIELLQLVKNSLLTSSPLCFLHHNNDPFHHPNNWYLGRTAMDPEPGRCRRTDGKKWRCSRDVVLGQKYCERHIHRGRNRSRKPVESPTPTAATTTTDSSGVDHAFAPSAAATCSNNGTTTQFSLSAAAATDTFQLNQGSLISDNKRMSLFESQHDRGASGGGDDHNSRSVLLRCFFDDWPAARSSVVDHNDHEIETSSSLATISSTVSFSMSRNYHPAYSSDNFLRLSTGQEQPAEPAELARPHGHGGHGHGQLMNWWGGGGLGISSNLHAATSSVGGPLAEALRLSTTSSSPGPTSVLVHDQLQHHHGSASAAS
ncbi:hypothetical protein Dimus_034729 [Dionaea muscipula]